MVDDDVVTRYLIGTALRDNKITTYECDSAEALFDLLQKHRIDVIVLDLVLPKTNGLDALTYLRKYSDVGVIMISSRANAQHRLNGLRIGADDFINKPVATDELILKIKSLAARVQSQRGEVDQDQLPINNCILITEDKVIARADGKLQLPVTESEQRILASLVNHENKTCSRKLLHQCVSRTELSFANDRSIDTLISRIRAKFKKLECTAAIKSIRGQGYRLQTH